MPREKQKDEEIKQGKRTPKLGKEAQTRYRSITMRANYLAQDRPDLAESCKALSQAMASPCEWDMAQATHLARYLVGRPRAKLRFREQAMPKKVTVFEDSDWCSCPITRKSTSGVLLLFGQHLLRSSSSLQSLITLSVAEAEYYSLTKGAAMGLALCSMMRELGLNVGLEIRLDSTSAESIGNRLGAGRVKHIESRFLWLQERVRLGHLEMKHVDTK